MGYDKALSKMCWMRGADVDQGEPFSYISLDSRIPMDHPLRPIRKMVDAALCYMEHVLMENRNGLAVDGRVTLAEGTAEREEIRHRRPHDATCGLLDEPGHTEAYRGNLRVGQDGG
jgi:hypothetical protein